VSGDPVVCISARNSVGCGHPVNDHDGNTARECCCCNWNHNDPAHVRDCINCHIRRIKADMGLTFGETTTADVIARQLPQHLRGPFWRAAIERYLAIEYPDLEAWADNLEAGRA
jgi:hypothetical protein